MAQTTTNAIKNTIKSTINNPQKLNEISKSEPAQKIKRAIKCKGGKEFYFHQDEVYYKCRCGDKHQKLYPQCETGEICLNVYDEKKYADKMPIKFIGTGEWKTLCNCTSDKIYCDQTPKVKEKIKQLSSTEENKNTN